jgi:hypothetical protein
LNNNKERNSKTWWKLLKDVYSANDRSYDSIPPIKCNGELVTNDKNKADVFNEFFVSMSHVEDGHSTFNTVPRVFNENDLSNLEIREQEVLDQLCCLDVSKSYGPDGVPPRLLKEGGRPLSIVLCRIFSLSLQTYKFPSMWKQANVTPLHKKDDQNEVSNYRPISLLSCVSKIFERIIFKHMYNHFRNNFILSDFQSGFLPGRSTTTQLIDVYHALCQAVDKEKEVRVVFLDIKKAFDKVWHKGLLYKLNQAGISGELLLWLKSYLSEREQRVVLNGQFSEWGRISAGVPQGSVLGPLLFLLYINDLVHEVRHCNIRFFADDTCLFIDIEDRIASANCANEDLERIRKWSEKWLVTFSPTKTKSLITSNKPDRKDNPPVFFGNTAIEEVDNHIYLGLNFSYNLKWNSHICDVHTKAAKRLNLMLPLKYTLDRKTLETIYTTLVRPVMEYSIIVWGGTYDAHLAKLEEININAMRIITGATCNSNIAKLYNETSLPSIKDRRDVAMLKMFFKIKNNQAPNYLQELLPPERHEIVNYSLRTNRTIEPPFARLESLKRSFILYAIRLWNLLPLEVRTSNSMNEFKKLISKDKDKNTLYYYGERWCNIQHARLRIGCSGLNYDLCFNVHVVDSPHCICGEGFETVFHYFFVCKNFNNQRAALQATVTQICNFDLETLLHGNDNLNHDENSLIFDAVHKFFIDTKRFN